MTCSQLALSVVGWIAWSTPAVAQECKSYEVAKGTGGKDLGGPMGGGSLSDDGRWVLFDGPHAPPPSVPHPHVWLRDESTGVTVQVDLSTSGLPAANWARAMDLSGDGTSVLFWSEDAMVPGDTNGLADLFVRDIPGSSTSLVSLSSAGMQADTAVFDGRLSANGRFVAYWSEATNLVPGDTNGQADVFVHDRQTGQTERVSVASDGSEGNGPSTTPRISEDGRWVVFRSWATNFAPHDGNGEGDAFVHDRQAGSTSPVSVTPAGGTGSGFSEPTAVSSDGRFVCFSSYAPDLVVGDTNGVSDAFLRDRLAATTSRTSVSASGAELLEDSFSTGLAAGGSIVLFDTASTGVTADDADDRFDGFRHDLATGEITLISEGWIGETGASQLDFFTRDVTPDGGFTCFSDSIRVFARGCPLQVARYGAAKPNSQACYPWITWSGDPSASAGSGFLVRVQGKLNQVSGLFIYGYQATLDSSLLPYLLVGPPIFRLPGTTTGGSMSGTDCTGSMQVDLNAWIASGIDPMLVPGVTVYGQFWSRDPGFVAPANYGFSDAIEITLLP